MRLALRPETTAISPRMVFGWRTSTTALTASTSVSPTTAAALPFGGCALRTSAMTSTSLALTSMARPATTGTATPTVFAPLLYCPLHSRSLTTARSVSTLHLPSARTAQLLARKTRPLHGSIPSSMPTATP